MTTWITRADPDFDEKLRGQPGLFWFELIKPRRDEGKYIGSVVNKVGCIRVATVEDTYYKPPIYTAYSTDFGFEYVTRFAPIDPPTEEVYFTGSDGQPYRVELLEEVKLYERGYEPGLMMEDGTEV